MFFSKISLERKSLLVILDEQSQFWIIVSGAESDVIVVLKYEKKDEAITNILKKATLKNTIAGIIFELTFENMSFRVYSSGKAIFRGIKKQKLNERLVKL